MKTGNVSISKWLKVLRRQTSHFSKFLVYNYNEMKMIYSQFPEQWNYKDEKVIFKYNDMIVL